MLTQLLTMTTKHKFPLQAGGRVNVVTGPRANQIYATVFTAVLNGSQYVLATRTGHGRQVYHFTKRRADQGWKLLCCSHMSK